MNISDKINDIVNNNEAEYAITGRELLHYLGFERRTVGVCAEVDRFLENKELMVEPHYNDVWIDSEIMLKHKPKAKTRLSQDPILRVRILEEATKTPVFIANDSPLQKAITLMRLYDYSQLPVTTNGTRGLCGYISWQTIGIAQANGVSTSIVKDYKLPVERTLKLDTPLLEAVKYVYQKEFAVVEDEKKQICGILTTTDISKQFLVLTEPFLLLEEIEGQIRRLMDNVFLLEDIKQICNEPDREVNCIDDLTFGEYIRLLQDDEKWNRLNVNLDKSIFLNALDKVREVRNDIMHFEPDGISEEQNNSLLSIAKLMKTLTIAK